MFVNCAKGSPSYQDGIPFVQLQAHVVYVWFEIMLCNGMSIQLSVFGTRDLFNISYSRELYLFSKFLHFEEIVRVKMAVCFEMIVSETLTTVQLSKNIPNKTRNAPLRTVQLSGRS